MKRLIGILTIALMALTLGACAGTTGTTNTPDKVQVKCPACGYEFLAPHSGN